MGPKTLACRSGDALARNGLRFLINWLIMGRARSCRATPEAAKRAPLSFLAFAVLSLTLNSYSCSSHTETPALAAPQHGSGGQGNEGGLGSTGGSSSIPGDSGDSGTSSGPCTVGDSRSCRVVLGVYLGQESCFVGMQYCDTGTWTPCIDPRDAG